MNHFVRKCSRAAKQLRLSTCFVPLRRRFHDLDSTCAELFRLHQTYRTQREAKAQSRAHASCLKLAFCVVIGPIQYSFVMSIFSSGRFDIENLPLWNPSFSRKLRVRLALCPLSSAAVSLATARD